MPKKRGGRSTAGNRSTGASGTAVLAFVLGAGAAAGAGYLYLHSTPHPVALQPSEAPRAANPASAAIANSSNPATPAAAPPSTPPFGTSEDVFEAGAHQYSSHCAKCHGTPQKDATSTPHAQQFWRKARHTVASQSPGELYSQISNGAPAKGMPGYARSLGDTQIWNLALLLKNADQDLPDPVLKLLDPSPKR